MSVILTGMELPNNCQECRLMVDYWCYAKTENGNPGPTYLYNRPDWCPLRPLPDVHGDLIDRNELLEEHERIVDSWGKAHIVSAGAIRNAPVIVEAEG